MKLTLNPESERRWSSVLANTTCSTEIPVRGRVVLRAGREMREQIYASAGLFNDPVAPGSLGEPPLPHTVCWLPNMWLRVL